MFFVERTGGWFGRGWRIGTERRAARRGGGLFRGPLAGLTLGAGLMYLLDPRRGSARRARLEGKAAHAVRATEALVESGTRDLEKRARGALAAARGRFRRDDADDDVVAQRVRAKLGRLTTHAHAIHVAVNAGRVELSGPVLSDEWQGIVSGVKGVRGVRHVVDRLAAHASAEHVPALQGGRPAAAAIARRWAPGPRLLAGGAGVWLLARGIAGGGLLGLPTAIAGVALLARAAANARMSRTLRGGADIHLHKSIRIEAAVDEVYAFFTEFQNLPRFMSHVREVRLAGEDRTRWVVDGPGGVPVEWEAVTTALEPNRLVAWESVRGSAVRTAGAVRFAEDGAATRMEVAIRYHPPAGALGHAIAKLLGADPKRQLDDDLARLKSLLEHGRARGREGAVTLDELKSVETMSASALEETPVGDSANGLNAQQSRSGAARVARETKGGRRGRKGAAPARDATEAAPPPRVQEEAARDERIEPERREPTSDGG